MGGDLFGFFAGSAGGFLIEHDDCIGPQRHSVSALCHLERKLVEFDEFDVIGGRRSVLGGYPELPDAKRDGLRDV